MRLRTFMITASAAALGFAGAANAGNNDLFIEQATAGNEATGTQLGNNNQTYIRQTGVSNSANGQIGDVSPAFQNDGLITQDGNQNAAAWGSQVQTTTFNGAYAFTRNTLGIDQDGVRNLASFNIQQQGPLTDSTIFVRQDGSDNYVGGGNGLSNYSVGNGSFQTSINVDGLTNNLGAIEGDDAGQISPQSGSSPSAGITGHNNTAIIAQDGVNNELALNVDGNNNTIQGAYGSGGVYGGGAPTAQASLSSNGGSLSSLGASLPESSLNGYTASSGFFDGAGDISAVPPATQDGSDNIGVIAQNGFNNTVGFVQLSSSNVAEVYQSGNSQAAVAYQD